MKNSASTDLIDDLINIVVYDKQSEHTNQLVDVEDKSSMVFCNNGTFAIILLNKLAQKFKSVSFLSGGFVQFCQTYPDLCQSSSALHHSISSTISTPVSSNNSSLTTTPNSSCLNKQFVLSDNKLEQKIIYLPFSHTNSSPSSSSSGSIGDIKATTHRPKFHVLKHSISSYDTNNEFFRSSLTPMGLKLNTQTSSINQSPSLTFDNEKTALLLSSPQSEHDAANNSLSNTTLISSEDPSVIREPTKILSFLYLGSQEDALSNATMTHLNITNVLNVSVNCPKPEFISDAHFLRIPVNDGHAAKIKPFFDVAYRFIGKLPKRKLVKFNFS